MKIIDAKRAVAVAWLIALTGIMLTVETPQKLEAQRLSVMPSTLAMTGIREPEAVQTIITDETVNDNSYIDALDLIVRCAFCEAGNQPEEGIRAVVDVIRNRVNDERFPDTYEEVIKQKGQFSVVTSGWVYVVEVPDWFYEIVEDQLQSAPVIDEDFIYFNGVPIGRDYIQIGGHWFGK